MDIFKKIAKEIDEKTFTYLNEQGYKIKKPYAEKRVLEIANQLKKEGKLLAWKLEDGTVGVDLFSKIHGEPILLKVEMPTAIGTIKIPKP